jgi:hypothetical protein
MTDDTCSPAGAPLDAGHLTPDQEPTRAPQVTRGTCHAVTRFGRPSNYSLPAWELARHIRQLRRQGWQHWEIRARFDFRSAA